MNIFLDENLSEHVAEALNHLNKGYFQDIKVSSTKTVFGKGARDEDIIPEVGKKAAILITRDLNIQRTSLQAQLCKDHKIGAFFISLPKGQNKHWDLVKLLIANWEEIIEKIKKSHFPFAYKIKVKGKMEKLY